MPKNVERNAEQKQAERNLKLQALERLLAGAGVDPEQDRSFKSIKTRLPGREEQYYSMLDEAAKLVRLMKDPNATAEDLGANFDMLAGETAKYLRGKEQSGAKQPEDFTRALDLLAISRDGGSRTGEIAGSALTEANIKRPSAERVDLKDYGAHRVLGVAKPPEPAREGLDPERNRTVEALERMLTGAAVDVTSDSARTLTERHKGRSRGYVNMLDEAASLCRTLKDPKATPEELQNAGMQLYNFCGQYMRGKEKVRQLRPRPRPAGDRLRIRGRAAQEGDRAKVQRGQRRARPDGQADRPALRQARKLRRQAHRGRGEGVGARGAAETAAQGLRRAAQGEARRGGGGASGAAAELRHGADGHARQLCPA